MKILSFSQLGNYGRLGNQLFEIASTIGLANRYNAKPLFSKDWEYREFFNIPDEYFGDIEFDEQVVEDKFHYLPDLLNNAEKNRVDVVGTLQSEKYFLEVKDKIKKYLKPKNVKYLGENSVGIHIRRGDYVRNPNYVNYGPEYYLPVILEHFNDPKYTFYICSDDPDYCRVHFKGERFIIEERGLMDDFAVMAGCHHRILCNSTFSWWAAYISDNKGLTIYPPKIFDGKLALTHNEGDFWPSENWFCFSKLKIPLHDTTFIIPVKFDHIDRKENLDIILNYFERYFYGYNVIIGEQGGSRFKYVSDIKNVRYVNFSYLTEFHRTHMLNRMTQLAETLIVVNYDCDVLFPPCQILEMKNMLYSGYGFVYPYSGPFLRIGNGTYERNKDYIKLLSIPDVGNLPDSDWVGKNDVSLGGAVGYQKPAFIDAGMENENFISYGHEDVERCERFKRLGYSVGRVDGNLYHLNHHCGVDSSTKNPFWDNGREELAKIRRMSDDELHEYVKSFEWTQDAKVVFVTYSDDKYERQQNNLCRMAELSGQFDYVFKFKRRDIDSDFYAKNKSILDHDRGGGYWLWKPYFILKALDHMDDGDIVLYLDSGDIFSGDIRRFLIKSQSDMILTDGAYPNGDYTHQMCFDKMGCVGKEYNETTQLETGILVFKKCNESIKLLKEWLEYCQDQDIITDSYSDKSINPSSFKDHRHDQSILTNLKIKHGITSSSEMRRFIRCNVTLSESDAHWGGSRVSLKDVTFVIPVMYDHNDRLENLKLIVRFIKKFFDTNIIVGEFFTKKMNIDGIKYVHFPGLDGFHRTKMINDMIKMSDTPIVVNMDADILVSPARLLEAVELVKFDQYDFVYPYNGKFVRVPRIFYSELYGGLDISILHEDGLSVSHSNSVGGIIVYNKEKFIGAGMENENFISHSPEDVERYRRFNVLGYRVGRTQNPLYHIEHYRGDDSSHNNDFRIINRTEWRKVKNLDRDGYIKYMKDWDWFKK